MFVNWSLYFIYFGKEKIFVSTTGNFSQFIFKGNYFLKSIPITDRKFKRFIDQKNSNSSNFNNNLVIK